MGNATHVLDHIVIKLNLQPIVILQVLTVNGSWSVYAFRAGITMKDKSSNIIALTLWEDNYNSSKFYHYNRSIPTRNCLTFPLPGDNIRWTRHGLEGLRHRDWRWVVGGPLDRRRFKSRSVKCRSVKCRSVVCLLTSQRAEKRA